MTIKRRTLGLWVGSTLFASAMPIAAFADDDDKVDVNHRPEGSREVAIRGQKHKAGATTAEFFRSEWRIDFKSDKVAEVDWKDDFPEHGHANILIDDKGNWQFQGAFPPQPLKHKCRVTVGVGLKSAGLGKILAAMHTLTLERDGGSWDKSGHDAIVGDLWKDAVKGGHEWVWSAHFRQERPQEPPPPPSPHGSSGGSGGESTGEQVGEDIGKSLLGPIGFFL